MPDIWACGGGVPKRDGLGWGRCGSAPSLNKVTRQWTDEDNERGQRGETIGKKNGRRSSSSNWDGER